MQDKGQVKVWEASRDEIVDYLSTQGSTMVSLTVTMLTGHVLDEAKFSLSREPGRRQITGKQSYG